MKYLAVFCATFLLLDMPSSLMAAEPQPHPWRRWAIVATPQLRQSGISDLLTARLTDVDAIELVEREQLDRVLRELDLAAHFGPEDAGRRLQLGKLLQADALVLLSVRQHEDQQFLRLVISDCVYGARLWDDLRPIKDNELADTTDWIAAAIENSQRRFRDGIKQLITVPPFLSKDLTHEHDSWQAASAALVASSLSRQPGVAVVEIEEVRAIQRELKIGDGRLQRAVVPLFIEAEFATSTRTAPDDLSIDLTVRLKDSQGTRSQLVRHELSTDQLVELLKDELPRRILQLGGDPKTVALPRSEQHRLLARRGAVFSAAGVFEHATVLREAALLLAPDDVDLRIALVLDYNRWQHARGRENNALQIAASRGMALGKQVDSQTWERTHAERLARFRWTTPHVEHLIRRRELNPFEANHLVSLVVRAMMLNTLANENRFGQQDKQALETFFWRVYPQFPKLDPAISQSTLRKALRTSPAGTTRPLTSLRQYHYWTREAMSMLLRFPRCTAVGLPPPHDDYSRTLEHLYRFLTEIPQREVPLTAMARLTTQRMNELIALGVLPIDDVREFYERLKASEQAFNTIYARCGLLALDIHSGAPPEPLRAEVQDLLTYFDRFDTRDTDFRSVAFAYRRELERLQETLQQRTSEEPQRRPLPTSPIPSRDPAPPLSFSPTGIPSPWLGMTRCHDALDVLWSIDRVDVMTAAAKGRTIFKLDVEQRSIQVSDMIYSAVWDGENIWVATMKSGVIVVSPTGEQLAHIHSATGLPPYDAQQMHVRYLGSEGASLRQPRPLQLHAVEPGKCVAVGQFGGNRRLWFAMIQRSNDGHFNVDLMHTATVQHDTRAERVADVEMVFPLQWTLVYTDPERPQRRLLLAGRALQAPDVTWPPLAIDLKSRTVSILGTGVPAGFERAEPQLAWEGSLLAVRDLVSPLGGMRMLTPPENSSAKWTGRELVPPSEPRLRGSYPAALVYRGDIYNPGVHWRRIPGEDLSAEVINQRPLALEHRFEFYGVSAHLGIVAWNRGDQLYQVLVEARQPSDLAQLYPFVPATQRTRHHAAVQAIRRLGGQVATQWGAARYSLVRGEPAQWRTIVYLPQQWSGADAGLSHLDDLYNLCELYAVQANISDDGLRHVANMERLETLWLVQTAVTDDGIAKLQEHPGLTFVQLDSSGTEPQFSDAAIAHLAQLPSLVALQLVGHGFTDASLKHLQNARRMRALLLDDTRITPAGIFRLKKVRPSLNVTDSGESRRRRAATRSAAQPTK